MIEAKLAVGSQQFAVKNKNASVVRGIFYAAKNIR